MKKLSGIFIAAILLLVSINAQPKPELPPPPKHEMMPLNLTDNQKGAIQEFRFEHQERMINLKSELEKSDLEIRKLLASTENIVIDDLKNLMDEKRDIKNKIEDERFNLWANIYNVLDDNQKTKWEKKLMFDIGAKDRFVDREMRHKRMKRKF